MQLLIYMSYTFPFFLTFLLLLVDGLTIFFFFLQLSDPSYPSIETRYCGNETPNTAWRSGSSVAQITLVSDGTVRGAGYSLAYNFVNNINCPEYDFSYSAFTAVSFYYYLFFSFYHVHFVLYSFSFSFFHEF